MFKENLCKDYTNLNCLSNQVQDVYFLDMFLFAPRCAMNSTSEMALVEILLMGRKEKFLLHPLIETFIKLKWRRTWKLYTFLVLILLLFYVFLCGYALSHNHGPDGQNENNTNKQHLMYGYIPQGFITSDLWW